jgi:hypothetical protein
MTAAVTTVSQQQQQQQRRRCDDDNNNNNNNNALNADFVVPQLQQRGRRVGQVVALVVVAVAARKVFALGNRPQGAQHV